MHRTVPIDGSTEAIIDEIETTLAVGYGSSAATAGPVSTAPKPAA